jgi:hypothetical protein
MSQRNSSRRDFLKHASTAALVASTAVTVAAAEPRQNKYTATAERVAILLESPDTPEPLRGMLCNIIEAYFYNLREWADMVPAATAERVRDILPELLEQAVREGWGRTDMDGDAIAFSGAPCDE